MKNGEGVTKTVRICVSGARNKDYAKKVACTVANSNLVKTSFFGTEPNWGRIMSSIGSCGLGLRQEKLNIFYGKNHFHHEDLL